MDAGLPKKRKRIAGREQGLVQRRGKKKTSSPIRKLVPDVLVNIFSHAMLADNQEFEGGDWDKVAPNNVAAVCRCWRRVALASPMLWATFRITSRTGSGWSHISRFIHRARQAPLDIKIHIIIYSDNANLVKFLLDNQSRFRNLDLKIGEVLDPHIEREPLPVLSNLPLLEVLRLECRLDVAAIRVDLADALRLRYLSSKSFVSCKFHPERILHNLVHVELSAEGPFFSSLYPLNVRDCLMVLRVSPNIEVFRAIRMDSTGTSHSGNAVHEGSHDCLARLSNLEIVNSDDVSIRGILDYFRLPALKKLTLTLSRDTGHGAQSPDCGLRIALVLVKV